MQVHVTIARRARAAPRFALLIFAAASTSHLKELADNRVKITKLWREFIAESLLKRRHVHSIPSAVEGFHKGVVILLRVCRQHHCSLHG